MGAGVGMEGWDSPPSPYCAVLGLQDQTEILNQEGVKKKMHEWGVGVELPLYSLSTPPSQSIFI